MIIILFFVCVKPIFALGKEWHPQCFVCSHPSCDRVLDPNDFETHDGKPYCKFHFGELFLPKCFACKKPITDVSFILILFTEVD